MLVVKYYIHFTMSLTSGLVSHVKQMHLSLLSSIYTLPMSFTCGCLIPYDLAPGAGWNRIDDPANLPFIHCLRNATFRIKYFFTFTVRNDLKKFPFVPVEASIAQW